MNKISIITINRNNSEGLKKTISSVLSQRNKIYEYIIIDGASTDESLFVIEQNKDSIAYWISEPDTGVFEAMNKGIKVATGDYCLFLNSGDYFVAENTLDLIFGTAHHSAPFINGNQINLLENTQNRVKCLNRELTLFDFYWGTIKHQATFIRRDLFDKYGLYDETLKIVSDWKFFLNTIGIHNEQPIFVDIDIVYFEWNGMSTNPDFDVKHEYERQTVLDQYFAKSIQSDYNRLRDLNAYDFAFKKMRKNKLFDKITRVLSKIF